MAYYADDFTGATDALEALTLGGVETALFVEPPDTAMLRGYSHVRAIGVAGNSRAMSQAQMDAVLPGAFRSLSDIRPAVVHYKVCSTFDSSPEIGSIGRAIEIGQGAFANRFTPVIVGVPQLQRFCVFGNLFARSGLDSAPYRLDRHPTMRRHPVTPMTEADLRVHLGQQTSHPIELLDVLNLDRGYDASRETLSKVTKDNGRIVLFDTLTLEHQSLIGRLLWEQQSQEQKPLFAVGSSSVEYALTKHWQAEGFVTNSRVSVQDCEPVDRTVVVSGSCSPVSKRQIAWAVEHGFVAVHVDVKSFNSSGIGGADVTDLVQRTLADLDHGKSVIVHTFGELTATSKSARDSAIRPNGAINQLIGNTLGRVLRDVLHVSSIQRVAVVGGDTSGCVARSLGIESLEMAAPLERGAPLCTARSRDPAIDGLEVVFKGGQVGYDSFFGSLVEGRPGSAMVGSIL